MIRPDQIPDAVVEAAAKAMCSEDGIPCGCVSACKLGRHYAMKGIPAALDAWPGVNLDAERCGTIILHLPKDNTHA